MVGIKICSDEKIDINSCDIKEKVSAAIADYIINTWDRVVSVENNKTSEGYEILYKVSL